MITKSELEEVIYIVKGLRHYEWLVSIQPLQKHYMVTTTPQKYEEVLRKIGYTEPEEPTNYRCAVEDMTFSFVKSGNPCGFSEDALEEVIQKCTPLKKYESLMVELQNSHGRRETCINFMFYDNNRLQELFNELEIAPVHKKDEFGMHIMCIQYEGVKIIFH